MSRAARPDLPTVEHLRSAAARAGRAGGLRLVVLFGSVARGELGARDLDIAVLHDGPIDAGALAARLARELDVPEVDLCSLRDADPLLALGVARDGVPLWEAAPGEFSRFAARAVRLGAGAENPPGEEERAPTLRPGGLRR
jgi:predicted nucleotidyltransferase